MTALTSTLVDMCSAGAGRVWLEQCLAMPQWAQMAQYRTRYRALQNTLDEVNHRPAQGQDCHLCVLTPDAIRSLQARWPDRIDAHYLGHFPVPHGQFTEYAVAAVRPHPDKHDPEAQTAWTLACDLARYLCSPSQPAMRQALGFAEVP
jgi:hypothetical protein